MITAAAVARAHDVTCLARGNGQVADGAMLVPGDRDRDDALAAVSEHDWDAVIDLTSHPVHARRAVRDLSSRHWVYVSSSSVYIRGDVLEQDESAPIADALDGDFMTDMAQYGPAKVACEDVYREHNRSHTIIRPGLIGGDRDYTGRSGYYPWRFAHPSGEDVLVPDPTFPIALIDVEDLATWIIHCAEEGHVGTFNATGRTTTLSEIIDLSRDITDSAAVPRFVPDAVLTASGVLPWMGPKSLPLWVNRPEFRYIATLDTSAAWKHGLRCRPLRETLIAALAYEERREQPRLAGLSDEEEQALRQAW
jgi:nucleoside-diphosphate-sugar epimerase